jgi:hypothetical protein
MGACGMIRNGLYHITLEMLDGVQGSKQCIRFKSKPRLLIAELI